MRSRLLVLGLAVVIAGVLAVSVPTGQASAWGNVHCVRYGETLYGIAGMYGTSAYAIAHANGLYNPNYIRAGMCLTIPSGYGYTDGYGGYGHTGYGQTGYGWSGGYDYGKKYGGYGWDNGWNGYGYKKPYQQTGWWSWPGYYGGDGYGKGGVHCVKYGETLSSIAWMHGVSTWSLASANGLYNPNWIRAGSCLRIP